MEAARRLVSRMRVIPLPAAIGAADGVALAGGAYACDCSYNSKIPALNTKHLKFSSASSSSLWRNKRDQKLPFIVKAGDPVLHQPALDIDPTEIKSEKIQKIIDDMILVMRKSPGVGLAAPQIGIPFRV
jgi:peptide deformylase